MLSIKLCLTACPLRFCSRVSSFKVLLQENLSRGNVKCSLARRNFSLEHVPELRASRRKKELGLTGWLLLTMPVGTFCLGTWQVKRKKWKESLIESLMIKTKMPPVSLPTDLKDIQDLEYCSVLVRGTFDHSKEIYIGPRSFLTDGQSKSNEGRLITSSGTSGYNVITPFILEDTNERILVNRGWVPFSQKSPKTRRMGQVEGPVELEGVVRLTEPRAQFLPANKPDVGVWFSRDVESMAQHADTIPVFIDAKVNSTVPGGPIGGQTRATLRNEHFSYIITWYSLSAATAFMWYSRYLK